MKSVCIAFASGCPRSRVDLAKLFPYFQANGWRIEKHINHAALVIVSACGVDISSESQSLRLIQFAHDQRTSQSQLVVMGCLAGIDEPTLRQRFDAIPISGPNLHQLDQLINARVRLQDIADPHDLAQPTRAAQACFSAYQRFRAADKPLAAKLTTSLRRLGERASVIRPERPFRRGRNRLFSLRLGRGCLEECSYCALRLACGPLHSKPLAQVLNEFDRGLQQGYQDYELLLEDVGAYGQDINTNIIELLDNLLDKSATVRLKLPDIGPHWLMAYFDDWRRLLLQTPRQLPYLLAPIQSGSQRILQLMRRRYRAADACHALRRLRHDRNDLYLATHVIVGFPGESDDDFEATRTMLKHIQFNEVGVYMYGDRPRTEASLIPDKLPTAIVRQRYRQLRREYGRPVQPPPLSPDNRQDRQPVPVG